MSALQALHDRVAKLRQRVTSPPASTCSTAVPPAITARGTLLQDATVRIESRSGDALLSVLFRPAGSVAAMFAMQRYDKSMASHMAAVDKCKRLRKGATVRVAGDGVNPVRNAHRFDREVHGDVIEVLFVRSIEAPLPITTRKDLE